MTDHAKQLAEEAQKWIKEHPPQFGPLTDDDIAYLAEAMAEFTRAKCLSLMAENERLRGALVEAVPWLFEHGSHLPNFNCYRGSDDGCYCGLDTARKIIEQALEQAREGRT